MAEKEKPTAFFNRRPLVIPPDNREMLKGIRDSLSHLSSLSRSTPNLLKGEENGSGNGTLVVTRGQMDYNANALKLIKKSLMQPGNEAETSIEHRFKKNGFRAPNGIVRRNRELFSADEPSTRNAAVPLKAFHLDSTTTTTGKISQRPQSAHPNLVTSGYRSSEQEITLSSSSATSIRTYCSDNKPTAPVKSIPITGPSHVQDYKNHKPAAALTPAAGMAEERGGASPPPPPLPPRIKRSAPLPPPPVPPPTYKEAYGQMNGPSALPRRPSPVMVPSDGSSVYSGSSNPYISGYPYLTQMVHPQQAQGDFMQMPNGSSPLSSNSPSPAPTPNPSGQPQYGQASAMPAWGIRQQGIPHQTARSRQVSRPMMYRATAPDDLEYGLNGHAVMMNPPGSAAPNSPHLLPPQSHYSHMVNGTSAINPGAMNPGSGYPGTMNSPTLLNHSDLPATSRSYMVTMNNPNSRIKNVQIEFRSSAPHPHNVNIGSHSPMLYPHSGLTSPAGAGQLISPAAAGQMISPAAAGQFISPGGAGMVYPQREWNQSPLSIVSNSTQSSIDRKLPPPYPGMRQPPPPPPQSVLQGGNPVMLPSRPSARDRPVSAPAHRNIGLDPRLQPYKCPPDYHASEYPLPHPYHTPEPSPATHSTRPHPLRVPSEAAPSGDSHRFTPVCVQDDVETCSNATNESCDDQSVSSETSGATAGATAGAAAGASKCHMRLSPKPERRRENESRDEEWLESTSRQYSSEAYKFYMEQHVENLLKNVRAREERRQRLEDEMDNAKLLPKLRDQLRQYLTGKESSYLRLSRAKMDKNMFDKIKPIGIGAFGEVALVRKNDTGALYAMKTLRKMDVLKRNQVAHVRAERDILAEADCEWVVKLYYSFQDRDNLYFIMDYIPGGDLMNLLILFGIFEEQLAKFYIAELVLAIESVHKMGFIHRDIKPDNILIDKDGHIKLTDFGLCTGFRWTHNSKYYQTGNHQRQDSMEPSEMWGEAAKCDCDTSPATRREILKPLQRRKQRHQRCLAHSLVGTPNYIAPEVLMKTGYSRVCDWWSVGVILYEMLVGCPPFLANTPQETQEKVINWEKCLTIPEEARLNPLAGNLILRLLTSVDRRLGGQSADDIKSHPFFQPLSFENMRQQKAPYRPKLQSAQDTSNFDSIDEDQLRSAANSSHDALLDNSHAYPLHGFFEFTFKRFFDDAGVPMMQGPGVPMMQGPGVPMMQGPGVPMAQSPGIPMVQGPGVPTVQGVGVPTVQGVGVPTVQGGAHFIKESNAEFV